MATPILGIIELTAAQDQKEVTINEAFRTFEASSNATLSLPITGDLTLTQAQLASAFRFRLTGGTGSMSTITIPTLERYFFIDNQTDAPLNFVADGGSESLVVASGDRALFYVDAAEVSDFITPNTASDATYLRRDGSNSFTGNFNLGGNKLTNGAAATDPNDFVTLSQINAIVQTLMPIGSIYSNATNGSNPSALLGFGTWIPFDPGRVAVAVGNDGTDTYTLEDLDGERLVTLAANQLPPHTHLMLQNSVSSTGSAITSNLTNADPVAKEGDAGSGSLNSGDYALRAADPADVSADPFVDQYVGLTGPQRDPTTTVTPVDVRQPSRAVAMWIRTA